MCRTLAQQLQLADVGAQPVHQLAAQVVGAGRQVVLDGRRKLCPGLFGEDDELFQQLAGVVHFLHDHPGDPHEEQRQQAHHQGAQQCHGQPAGAAAARDHRLQAGRQGDDQFIDQQPRQQGRQEPEGQYQQQTEKDDGPAGQEQLTITEDLHRSRALACEAGRQSASGSGRSTIGS
ncbi:hypothetical protein D9M71_370890 [compost metagenome]